MSKAHIPAVRCDKCTRVEVAQSGSSDLDLVAPPDWRTEWVAGASGLFRMDLCPDDAELTPAERQAVSEDLERAGNFSGGRLPRRLFDQAEEEDQ